MEALAAGDFEGALELAQRAVADDPAGGWGYYVRATALLALKRTDDAERSFRAAERRFPASAAWSVSVAIWGQANALFEARPCRDAKLAYERYVAFVAPIDPAAAAMGRAFAKKQCVPSAQTTYVMRGPAWEYYLRGDALVAQRRYDEAVAAYQTAEQQFSAGDTWGISVAIWGQANALVQAGRCAEAAPIFLRYAKYVERRDSQAAALARKYAQHQCVPLRK